MDELISILSKMNIEDIIISEEEFEKLTPIMQETYIFNLRSVNNFLKRKLHKM